MVARVVVIEVIASMIVFAAPLAVVACFALIYGLAELTVLLIYRDAISIYARSTCLNHIFPHLGFLIILGLVGMPRKNSPSKSETIYFLREQGFSIAELAKMFYPDLELSRAKLRVNSLLYKYRKRKKSMWHEYCETREYSENEEVIMVAERNYAERTEVVEDIGEIGDLEELLELKRRGLLKYDEERYLETKMFLHFLYERYCSAYDRNKFVWRSILYYNRILNREVFPRRPGSKITRKMVSYFITMMIKIYMDTGWQWIKEAINKAHRDYNISGKDLEKMLPYLAKIM